MSGKRRDGTIEVISVWQNLMANYTFQHGMCRRYTNWCIVEDNSACRIV